MFISASARNKSIQAEALTTALDRGGHPRERETVSGIAIARWPQLHGDTPNQVTRKKCTLAEALTRALYRGGPPRERETVSGIAIARWPQLHGDTPNQVTSNKFTLAEALPDASCTPNGITINDGLPAPPVPMGHAHGSVRAALCLQEEPHDCSCNYVAVT